MCSTFCINTKMRKHVLYAYAEGGDFDLVAAPITERLDAFIANREWISGDARVVNQQRRRHDSPDGWDLGINLELPDPNSEPSGWFEDVEEIAITCNELARDLDTPFVIGISDQQSGIADDLFGLVGGAIDVERLKAIIGAESPK
jgi:hypothetical protein